MPKKLNFHVVHVSGEDDQYRASELNSRTPLTKGWQSTRFCMYPQTIVVQLQNRSRLSKIQLLSHQYLISSKIEIFSGEVSEGMPVAMANSQWTRLGYVMLSDNEKTQFRARELKSCHVDAIGHFIKLLLHKNHINKYNLYNQVGLLAINLIGEDLNAWQEGDPEREELLRENPAIAGALRNSESNNPLDDLAFDMYQDPEVAAIIRRLDMKKQQAIIEERYDFAKRVKDMIVELQQVGEKLGKMDVEKRQTVALEDFDKAHLIKLKMDEYRLQMYKELHVNDLLDVAGSFKLGKVGNEDLDPRMRSPKLKLLKSTQAQSPPLGRSSRRGDAGGHTPTVEVDYDPQDGLTAYQRYEDRPLPALAKKQQHNAPLQSTQPAITEEGSQPDDLDGDLPEDGKESVAPTERTFREDGATTVEPGGESHAELEPLDEKDLREAAPVIDVFGLQSVTKAFSKTWSFRENAILAVFKQMEELDKGTSPEEARAMYHAAVYLVKKAISDPVFAVFRSGLTLLRAMVTQFSQKFKIPKSETQYCLEKVVPPLLNRFNDTSQRVRDLAKNSLMELGVVAEIKSLNYIPPECLKPFKGNTPPRVAILRAEVAEGLYKKFNLTSGITIENLGLFCMAAMDHPSGEVHEPAIRILCQLQKETGNSPEFRGIVNLNNDTLLKKPNYRKLAELLDAGTTTIRHQPHPGTENKAPPASRGADRQQRQAKQPKPTKQPPVKQQEDSPRGQPVPSTNKEEEDRASVILSNMCIFCLDKNDGFDEKGLNIHYFTACPMLRKCEHCAQVIEISGLYSHWLNDCTAKELYSKCTTCGDAVLHTELETPKHKRACRAVDVGNERCPLCLSDVSAGDDSVWREHLMGGKGCPANPRRVTGAAAGDRIKQRQAVLAANGRANGKGGRK